MNRLHWMRITAGLFLVVANVFANVAAPLMAEESAAGTAVESRQFVSPITVDDIRPHIEYLASPELRGRSGEDARKAAEYIKRHFEKIGVQPLFDGSYFQAIPGVEQDDGTRDVMGHNVAGWIPGSDPALRDEFVIVSAHHDHLGVRNGVVYRGADDNASGVAMMLEVARQVAAMETKPRRSLVFIGFDLEERMLWGSRWFAAHPPWPLEQIKLFITADMIGRSLGNLPLPTVFVLGSEHAPSLKTTLDRVGTPQDLEVARMGIDLIGTRSDYGPFMASHVPFLFFSTGEHPDYHTPRDVPERLDFEKAARVSGLVLKVAAEVANDETPPEWTNNVTSDLDEARALHRIATLLLESQRELTDIQKLLVTHAQNKTRQILERGKMTPADRTWLIRTAQLMLLSVF